MDAAEKALLKEKAHRIADMLGEHDDVPRAQIYRILKLMGEQWVRTVIGEVEKLSATSATITARTDGTPRTIGGMFFKAARAVAWAAMERGEITRPDFHRAFHGWPKQVRPPKPPPVAPTPVPKPAAPRAPGSPRARPYPSGDVRLRGRSPASEPTVEQRRPRKGMPMLEVTVVRRRASA